MKDITLIAGLISAFTTTATAKPYPQQNGDSETGVCTPANPDFASIFDAAHPVKGPVMPGIFADPSVMYAEGAYWAYSTIRKKKDQNAPVASSPDFVHWTMKGDALEELPEWAADGDDVSIWAPDVIQSVSFHFTRH